MYIRICVFFHLSIDLSIYRSIYPSIYPSLCLCQSLYLCLYLSLCPFLSIHLSTYLHICLSTYLSFLYVFRSLCMQFRVCVCVHYFFHLAFLAFSRSILLSIYPAIVDRSPYRSVYLSLTHIHLPTYLSICLPTCIPIYLLIAPYLTNII